MKLKEWFNNSKNVIQKILWNETFIGNMRSTSSGDSPFFISRWISFETIASLIVMILLFLGSVGSVALSNKYFNSQFRLLEIELSKVNIINFYITFILLVIILFKPKKFFRTNLTFCISKLTLIISMGILLYQMFGFKINLEWGVILVTLLTFQLYLKIPYQLFCKHIIYAFSNEKLELNEKLASHFILTIPGVFFMVEVFVFILEKITNSQIGGSGNIRLIVELLFVIFLLLTIIFQSQFVKRLFDALAFLVTIVVILLLVLTFRPDFVNVKSENIDLIIFGVSAITSLLSVSVIERVLLFDLKKRYLDFCSARDINGFILLVASFVTTVVTPIAFVFLNESQAFFLLGIYITLLFLIIIENQKPLIKFLLLMSVSVSVILLRIYFINNIQINGDNALMIVYLIEILCMLNIAFILNYADIHLNENYFDQIFNQTPMQKKEKLDELSGVEKIRLLKLIEQQNFKEMNEKYGIANKSCYEMKTQYWSQYYFSIFKNYLKKMNYSNKRTEELFVEFKDLKVIKHKYSKNKSFFDKILKKTRGFYRIKNITKESFEDVREVEKFVRKILKYENENFKIGINEKKVINKFVELKMRINAES